MTNALFSVKPLQYMYSNWGENHLTPTDEHVQTEDGFQQVLNSYHSAYALNTETLNSNCTGF